MNHTCFLIALAGNIYGQKVFKPSLTKVLLFRPLANTLCYGLLSILATHFDEVSLKYTKAHLRNWSGIPI